MLLQGAPDSDVTSATADFFKTLKSETLYTEKSFWAMVGVITTSALLEYGSSTGSLNTAAGGSKVWSWLSKKTTSKADTRGSANGDSATRSTRMHLAARLAFGLLEHKIREITEDAARRSFDRKDPDAFVIIMICFISAISRRAKAFELLVPFLPLQGLKELFTTAGRLDRQRQEPFSLAPARLGWPGKSSTGEGLLGQRTLPEDQCMLGLTWEDGLFERHSKPGGDIRQTKVEPLDGADEEMFSSLQDPPGARE